MKLKYFYGTLFEWCSFVNENAITQKQISHCQFYTNNGQQYVIATIWEQE